MERGEHLSAQKTMRELPKPIQKSDPTHVLDSHTLVLFTHAVDQAALKLQRLRASGPHLEEELGNLIRA